MSETRCGFCAIIGAPNAGKSTLVNQLAGSKVSIVSHKVQTTRARLRAIFMEGDSQVIVVDTPGIFNPKRKLDEAMVENAWSGSAEADVTVLLADARLGRNDDVMRIIDGLKKNGTKALLVLNKVDLLRREVLLEISKRFNE
ncbi:MAG: 50S ribosome-binding GTPase, partial [Rhizobiales bacterium]|nr:50S ribosome-binding GTPase [Hyphomicrobiales bacterium]